MEKSILLKNWRDYQDDITTDSLWLSNVSTKNRPLFIIPKRPEMNISNSNTFHGLFIPEIPYQFIQRFYEPGKKIWDCFGGSGTTYRVVQYLNCSEDLYISDINPQEDYISYGDATTDGPDYKCDLVFCHPPYHNIVKYSDKDNDGSNCKDVNDFLGWLDRVAINITNRLNDKGIVILVLGNIYEDGEEKTLGVWGKDVFCKHGLKCKSHIIKDYGETKGSEGRNYNLNYYRQLKNGYNNFYGDNIFILKKEK